MSDYKKRVLFIGEASFLETGFSNYYRQLLPRLMNTEKFEIGEFGSYAGQDDPRGAGIPWKFYGVLPSNENEARVFGNPRGSEEEQKRYNTNQFGEYKFTEVLLDFKPDIVVGIRDWWMDEYVLRSPYCKDIKFIWMPTVDGMPQATHWIDDYKNVDMIIAYSHFGKKILENQSNNKIKVTDVISAGVDLDTFHPMDRQKLMHKWALRTDKNTNIIGSVMRNQSRKLFPRLIQSYKKFKNANPTMARHTCLWLHTSYPDVGFDIPEYVKREGLETDVLFTYVCHSCAHVFVSWFLSWDSFDAKKKPQWEPMGMCEKCGQKTAAMPNTQRGVTREQLAEIYNMFSLYVQASNSEGQGMPIVEAKACGVPVLCVDYSAMSEQGRNGGALPIRVQTLESEGTTGVYRALFDRDDLATKMAQVLSDDNKEEYEKMKIEARECVEKEYNWDIQYKKWEKILDAVEIQDRSTTWDKPVAFLSPIKQNAPAQICDEDFVAWCYTNILDKADEPHDSPGFVNWINSLAKDTPRLNIEGFFRQAAAQHNLAEQKRTGVIAPENRIDTANTLRGQLI